MAMIPPSEEVMRQQVMPILDAIAERCRDNNQPLLTLMATNHEDGRRDYDAIRRHWQIRYSESLPTDAVELEAIVAAEELKVHIYCRLGGGR